MMSSPAQGSGRDFLAKKSDLTKFRKKLPVLTDFLVVDDNTYDGERLRATLHLMFGYDINVRRAKTLGSALDQVIEKKPELIILDDILPPSDTATTTIPFLRRCGYDGPIVVVSSELNMYRRAELLTGGAADVVHKDDLDSVRIAEALVRVFKDHAPVEA